MILNTYTLAATSLVLAGSLLGCSMPASTPASVSSAPAVSKQPGASSATLQANHWQLKQALNAQGQPQPQWLRNAPAAKPMQIDFLPGQMLSVQNLCNNMHGRYSLDGAKIRVERMASTLMACGDQELMALEHRVGSLLPQARQWQISGQSPLQLELQFEDGTRWQLEGQPTHESRYGQSTRIFLEVAAAKVPCNHPLMPNAQCLQVRSIDYDAQGIKGKIGEWQVLHDQIEGYQHEAGTRNVLRLKRFERPNPPADASRYLYVHDMTVESELVRAGAVRP